MSKDGDRWLDIVGGVLLLVLVGSVGLIVISGMNPPSSEGPTRTPNADWELQPVNDSHVRIAYTGSDPVSTENLTVTVDQHRRAVSWSGVLTRGESGVVQLRAGGVVRLYWNEGRDGQTLLKQWQLGEDDS